jgi:hypothetical protein
VDSNEQHQKELRRKKRTKHDGFLTLTFLVDGKEEIAKMRGESSLLLRVSRLSRVLTGARTKKRRRKKSVKPSRVRESNDAI